MSLMPSHLRLFQRSTLLSLDCLLECPNPLRSASWGLVWGERARVSLSLTPPVFRFFLQ